MRPDRCPNRSWRSSNDTPAARKIVEIGAGPFAANVVIGEVVMFHVNQFFCDDDKKVDPDLLDAVGRLGGTDYGTTRDRFSVE